MARSYTMRGVLGAADRAVSLARQVLLAQAPTSLLHDVQVDPRFQHRGVDLLWEREGHPVWGIEVKGDRQGRRRGNYFFELISNAEKDSPGCFLYSTADLLVYVADLDGDGDMDFLFGDASKIAWYENLGPRQPGDADQDFDFDQLDLVQVSVAAKYLTGEPADWSEGDWTGDGAFDQLDIVAALQTGNFLQGPYAADASEVNPPGPLHQLAR